MVEKITELEVLKEQKLTKTSINVNSFKKDIAKYFSKDEIDEKIFNIKNYKHKLFVKFLWMSGVRVTQAINVRKKDIDFDNYVMRIRWLKSRKWNEQIIPIHPQLKDMLEFYVAPMNMEDYLFPFTRQRAWKITTEAIGGSPHQLRHSFAVHWLRSGGDIVILSKILGHSKIQITMEYLKIVPIDQGKELIKIQF